MKVYVVHHADAVSADVDPERPLSARGHVQAEWLADQVKAAGFSPGAILHSGKLRARQTAEPFLRCNPFAEYRMIRGLRPDDAPEIVRDVLLAETRDVVIVGHMPLLQNLVRLLAPQAEPFPAHGVVALERRSDPPSWIEVWRAQAR